MPSCLNFKCKIVKNKDYTMHGNKEYTQESIETIKSYLLLHEKTKDYKQQQQ